MKVTCPRCGMEGNLEEICVKSTSGRELCYYRVVHYYKLGNKRRKKTCYLGPVTGEYEYVEKVHGLGLTNILNQDPSRIVYNAVSRLIDQARMVKEDNKREILERARRLRETIMQLLPELEDIEKELGEGEQQ
jgi:hypothetical protein